MKASVCVPSDDAPKIPGHLSACLVYQLRALAVVRKWIHRIPFWRQCAVETILELQNSAGANSRMCDQKVTPAVQHRQQSHGMASMIVSTYHPGRPCGKLLHDAQVARARRRVRSTEGIYRDLSMNLLDLCGQPMSLCAQQCQSCEVSGNTDQTADMKSLIMPSKSVEFQLVAGFVSVQSGGVSSVTTTRGFGNHGA